MKITIHRGTQEIGGNCVELEQDGQRIVLDVGIPIQSQLDHDIPLPSVAGFENFDPSLLAVLISHPHLDHYGLAARLPEDTKFFLGPAARRILEAANTFTSFGLKLKNCETYLDRQPVRVGPFTITPFLVDHSAYDSYAFLIETEGSRLFYSGDFRGHGRKASLLPKFVSNVADNVDCLLMEGTNMSRSETGHRFPSEADLENEMASYFQQANGMPLVWCSSQNIDRIVTIFRACRKTKRQLIIDMYTAEILRATENDKIPQSHWDGVRVFLPQSQKRQVIAKKAFAMSQSYACDRIYPEQLAEAADHSVMLFRPSMVRDLDAAQPKLAGVLCSVWEGYLRHPTQRRFLDWTEERGLEVHHCHTSGHACVDDLIRVREAFPSAKVVPIHLENLPRFLEIFPDAIALRDGQSWII